MESLTHVTLVACEEGDPEDVNSTAKVCHGTRRFNYFSPALMLIDLCYRVTVITGLSLAPDDALHYRIPIWPKPV